MFQFVAFGFYFSLSFRRTNCDILELSEISLDLNLVNSNIRYKFTDSPILAVSIAEINEYLYVLVATVSCIHQLRYSNPNQIHKSNDETQSYSVFHEATTQTSLDPSSSLFYVIGHAATPSETLSKQIPINEQLISMFVVFGRLSDTTYGRMHSE